MARNHSKRKAEAYQALASINQHFEAIAQHVHDLGQTGFFRVRKMNVLAGFVRELQAHISHDVVDQMHTIEDKNMFELEKSRREWEEYLDPDKAAKPKGKLEQQPQPQSEQLPAGPNGLAEGGSHAKG